MKKKKKKRPPNPQPKRKKALLFIYFTEIGHLVTSVTDVDW